MEPGKGVLIFVAYSSFTRVSVRAFESRAGASPCLLKRSPARKGLPGAKNLESELSADLLDPDDFPLANIPLYGDVHNVVEALAANGPSNRRCGGHHREVSISVGTK